MSAIRSTSCATSVRISASTHIIGIGILFIQVMRQIHLCSLKIDVESCSTTCTIKCWIGNWTAPIFWLKGHHFLSFFVWEFRYDLNRLCCGIHCLEPFDNFREDIKIGYCPNMTTNTSSYIIPSRPNCAKIRDLNRDSDYGDVKIADLERWLYRLHEAIDNGFCVDVSASLCLFELIWVIKKTDINRNYFSLKEITSLCSMIKE